MIADPVSLSSLGASLVILRCATTGITFRALTMFCPICSASAKPKHDLVVVPYHYEPMLWSEISPSHVATGELLEELGLEGEIEGFSCGLRGEIKGGHWVDHGHE
jgi:hypothetical protein